MGIHKTVKLSFFSLSFLVLLPACIEQTVERVPDRVNTELRNLKAENKELRQENSSLAAQTIDGYKTLNEVVVKLGELSGQTFMMRQNIESGDVDYSLAEKADQLLKDIKMELETARKGDKTNMLGEYKILIDNLALQIEAKEKEIQLLKSELAEKEEIIKRNKTEITRQQSVILDQARIIVEQQGQAWYDMGKLLYDVSESYSEGAKGFLGIHKSNYKKMKDNKVLLLNESRKCFKRASDEGVVEARPFIIRIDQELEAL